MVATLTDPANDVIEDVDSQLDDVFANGVSVNGSTVGPFPSYNESFLTKANKSLIRDTYRLALAGLLKSLGKLRPRWIALNTLNGWTVKNYILYELPSYSVDVFGRVRMRGRIQGTSTNVPVVVLPSGARPQKEHAFVVASDPTGSASGSGSATIKVLSNGQVVVTRMPKTPDWISLDTVSFDAI